MYLFIYDRPREREREREGQRHRRREKQVPCREPDVGLNPVTPGPHPGPKAGTKALSHPWIPPGVLFKKNLQIYLRERERKRQRHRRREKQAPCREPDMELDPGTPGLCPGPKAGAKPLSHPGIPGSKVSFKKFF